MKKIQPVLSFVCTIVASTGKAKIATRISVRVGGVEVAWKIMGCVYTQSAAQREWRLNRRTFTLVEETAAMLAMVA
jgi:hypothetical protein